MPSQGQGKRRLTTQDSPTKRFRVSRACDQCRIAREKCDGQQPLCEPCIEAKRSCTYTSNPKKRGLQPGYIRSLEMTLALIFQYDSDIETMVNSRLAQQGSLLLERDTKESIRLHKSWAKSKFCRDVNKALSGEQIGSRDDKMPSSDEDSELDVEQVSLSQIDSNPRFYDQIPLTYNPGLRSDISATAVVSEQGLFSNQPGMLSSKLTPLPANCWTLLDTYSTYTQCWLPISEKLDIIKLSYSYPEEGLYLSPDIADAGSHAEMWSIFAVSTPEPRTPSQDTSPEQLYITVKALIPDELGNFELGHVKALLNLAVFNIKRLEMEAAWRLVGAASRILPNLSKSSNPPTSRYKIVLASCFLLDSMLSLHLQRRPYFGKADAPKIEEDGMEEWQPWSGVLMQITASQSRTPTLALSHFNGLLDLVDMLVSTTLQSTNRNFLHEMIGRLEVWKTALPSRFNYIRSDSTVVPMTPPAVLLQLTYLTTIFALVPSSDCLQRILSLLNALNTHLGFKRAPPIIMCLVQSIMRSSTSLDIDQPTQVFMQQVFTDIHRTFSVASNGREANVSFFTGTSPNITHLQNRAMNHEMPVSQQGGPSIFSNHPLNISPAHHATTVNILTSRPFANVLDPSTLESSALDPLDSYNAFMTSDLEGFFDDLASIHGGKKLQNQPRFMQNLGYSSDVSMADLIATDSVRFMPLPTPSNFNPGNHEQSPQFPRSTSYEAG